MVVLGCGARRRRDRGEYKSVILVLKYSNRIIAPKHINPLKAAVVMMENAPAIPFSS